VDVGGLLERRVFPRRFLVAALVVPIALLAALIWLDAFVLEPTLDPTTARIAMLGVGAAGVVAYSAVILARLGELYQREMDQHRRLRALNAAGLSLSAELDTEALLQKIADLARIVGDAQYAALGTFDENGLLTRFLTSGITPDERARIGHLPYGRGLLGLLPRQGEPIRLREIAEHPASVGFPAEHPPMHSFLGVPITWRGRSVGNLYLTEKRDAPEFSADDEEALKALAAQAAIAIENARLYDQVGRIAVLEERHRIGMDLHDGAIQSLYGISLQMEAAADRAATAPAETRDALHRLVDVLNASIADLRGYVLGLRPIRGSDRPLSESLPSLADQVGRNALLDVTIEVPTDTDRGLDREAREAIFYVAADALGNVARHARARRVSVRIESEDGAVALEVRDDGVGFDPERVHGGLGLRNMRERAFSLGGRLEISGRPGEGTLVRFVLPTTRPVTA